MKGMIVVDMAQLCKRMAETMPSSCYVEAFHELAGEMLTCLEGDDHDRVVVPCLVFFWEQVT